MDKLSIDIHNMKKNIYKLWIDTKDNYPDFIKRESYFQKVKKGRDLNSYIKNFFSLLTHLIKEKISSEECKSGIIQLLKTWFIESSPRKIDDKRYLEEFVEGMCNITDEFVREARSFCSEINNEEILQALKNVWAMVLYQYVTLGHIKLTKSIFAYSMLYPCTDNYIDDVNVTNKEKKIFNENVLQKLLGSDVYSDNYEFIRVSKLIDMIEEEYPRENNSHIYDAMVYMQKAQQLSLSQQSNTKILNEKDLLEISIEKGGLSVLMHGYLVSGDLENCSSEFLYAFGVLLQICDDIQDIKEDLENEHYTLATKVGEMCDLDSLTNNLFFFSRVVFKEKCKVQNEKFLWIYEVMELKIYNLIIFSVYSNSYMYSKKYTKNITKNFPYTMFYLKTFNLRCNLKLRKFKKKLGQKNISGLLYK